MWCLRMQWIGMVVPRDCSLNDVHCFSQIPGFHCFCLVVRCLLLCFIVSDVLLSFRCAEDANSKLHILIKYCLYKLFHSQCICLNAVS